MEVVYSVMNDIKNILFSSINLKTIVFLISIILGCCLSLYIFIYGAKLLIKSISVAFKSNQYLKAVYKKGGRSALFHTYIHDVTGYTSSKYRKFWKNRIYEPGIKGTYDYGKVYSKSAFNKRRKDLNEFWKEHDDYFKYEIENNKPIIVRSD